MPAEVVSKVQEAEGRISEMVPKSGLFLLLLDVQCAVLTLGTQTVKRIRVLAINYKQVFSDVITRYYTNDEKYIFFL